MIGAKPRVSESAEPRRCNLTLWDPAQEVPEWKKRGKRGCSRDAGQDLLLPAAEVERIVSGRAALPLLECLGKEETITPEGASAGPVLRPSLLSNLAVSGAEESSGHCLSQPPCHPSTDSSGPFMGAKSQNQSPLKPGGKTHMEFNGLWLSHLIHSPKNENYSYFLLLNELVSSPCKCVVQAGARKIKAE